MTDVEFQEFMVKHLMELSTDVKQIQESQVRMESELTEKISGLYDFRQVQDDVNEGIKSSLERIEAKVDVLQLETAHLRRVK